MWSTPKPLTPAGSWHLIGWPGQQFLLVPTAIVIIEIVLRIANKRNNSSNSNNCNNCSNSSNSNTNSTTSSSTNKYE